MQKVGLKGKRIRNNLLVVPNCLTSEPFLLSMSRCSFPLSNLINRKILIFIKLKVTIDVKKQPYIFF